MCTVTRGNNKVKYTVNMPGGNLLSLLLLLGVVGKVAIRGCGKGCY